MAAMRRLVTAGLLPEPAGQPVKAWVYMSLADLMVLDGSSALLEEWTARVRAQWAGHRAQASAGGSDGGAWLDSDAAGAVACDAAMVPFVTGDVNPAALDDLVRLCVQLDRLRHHPGGDDGGQDDPGSDDGGQDGAGRTGTGGTGSDGRGAPGPDTARAWEALERAIIGKTIMFLMHSHRWLDLQRLHLATCLAILPADLYPTSACPARMDSMGATVRSSADRNHVESPAFVQLSTVPLALHYVFSSSSERAQQRRGEMGEYNFGNLSPYDFEQLIRDLLQSAEGIKLRSFAPGRDRGIDLRGWESRNPSRAIVVQCKHMMNSSWTNIKAIVKKEKLKLDQLKRKPGRYILAVTKSLTAENIDELFEILKPYCLTSDDILDVAAIEQLLSDNEAVLQRHYKLWITSTPILQRIVHAGIYNRSESYREQLLRTSRTFVQPNAFPKARQALKDHHICIISGPPGVGKTTLAEMLCLEYLRQDFELVVISEDVSEGDEVYDPTKKQIFIYDDFLGRTDIYQKLGKNEDNRIIQFIRLVQRSLDHRFILTSPELRAAQATYDRLDTGELVVLKFAIEMRNYTQVQKGLILYQHLAFSENIDKEGIEDLIRRRVYHQIVDHDNYTPRHIADGLKAIALRKNDMPLANNILAVLDDPTHMWSHALRALSNESRRLFLTLTLLPHPIAIDDLQVVYSAQRFDRVESFSDSLQTLDDSFTSIVDSFISISAGRNQRWIDFRNPSLQDFAQEYLNQHPDWLDSLLGMPVYYEQIARTYELAMAQHPDRISLPPRSAGPPYKKAVHKGAAKYVGIRAWVTRRHSDLLAKAMDLALSNSVLSPRDYSHGYVRWLSRSEILNELIQIILAFDESLNNMLAQTFSRIIEQALESASMSSAADMLELIQGHKTGQLIEQYYAGNAVETLRSSILHEDDWKFPLLAKMDEALGTDPNVSMSEWGNDYVMYANQTVEELSNSDNWERLDQAINELEDTAYFLGLDLFDSISVLETRRDSLPPDPSEDYEGYGFDTDSSSLRDGDMSSERQLDNIFRGLLE